MHIRFKQDISCFLQEWKLKEYLKVEVLFFSVSRNAVKAYIGCVAKPIIFVCRASKYRCNTISSKKQLIEWPFDDITPKDRIKRSNRITTDQILVVIIIEARKSRSC